MQNIFRKVSLDRLSSPEQLDQVMQVTRPQGWLALASIGLLLVVALVWGALGTLAEKVGGRGILVKSGGILEVVTEAGGRVTDVAVQVGDSVTQGQVVAWIAQPALLEQSQAARNSLELLRREHEQQVAFRTRDAELQRRNLNQQRANVEASIAAAEASLRNQEERLASQETLVRQGLVTRASLLQTQQQAEQTREAIRASRAELAQIPVRLLAVENELQQARSGGEHKIAAATAEIGRMERDVRNSSQIVSPYTGRILEVMSEPGKVIARGEPLLTLDLTGSAVQELVAVMYIPSVQGKKVKPGMEIQVAPSTVRQEEYGMMLGRVTFVSNFPATPAGMLRVLKNERLVTDLAGADAPYEVHAELQVDPATPSRYRWSSSQGPPQSIQSGTVASGRVTVATERPIGRVIPLLRNWTGM
jgi:HlyD family secretion protein